MLFLIILLILLIIIHVYLKFNESYSYWKKKNVKFVKPQFLFGNMIGPIFQTKTIIQFIEDLCNTFPNARYFGIYKFTEPVLIIKDLNLVKQIMIKHFENFVDHATYTNHQNDPIWAKSIVAVGGDQWKKLHQTLRPAFTISKMRILFGLMNECSENFIDFFKNQTDNNAVIKEEMKNLFSRYITDMNASLLFGITLDSNTNPDNEFRLTVLKALDMSGLNRLKFFFYVDYPLITRLFNIRIIDYKSGKFFDSAIKDTVQTRARNNIKRSDLLQLLIEAKQGNLNDEPNSNSFESNSENLETSKSEPPKPNKSLKFLTDDDITSQAIVFFGSGYESVSTTLTLLTYELALNLEIQSKLRQEFMKITEEITYESLMGIKYLDMVINEALRRWNPFVFTDRRCTKQFTIEPESPDEKPLTLNVGDNIWIPIWAFHHDPKYFPNPLRFDPERFNDENKAKIEPYSFMPFGAGPRACIGYRYGILKIKIFLYHLLRSFEIVPTEETEIPVVMSTNSIFLNCKGGMNLGLKPIRGGNP